MQIAANAERRRHEREESLQEGARVMAQLQQHRRKVEVRIAVPPKVLTSLCIMFVLSSFIARGLVSLRMRTGGTLLGES